MKLLPRLLLLSSLVLVPARAADSVIDAVRRADDARVAATLAADQGALDTVFSLELRYAHASGKVDTKASYLASIVSHSTVYDSYKYLERNFLPAAPGIVLMTGRALIHSHTGDQQAENDLNFLAVWREENGVWRFLAWQACKNPPPAPAPTK